MKINLILFFSLLAFQLKAQPKLDSLFTLWQDSNLTDSTRVLAYNDYVQIGYLFSRPDTTVILAENLHVYALENDYPRAAAQGFRLQGIANAIMGNYDSAEKLFKKSLNLFEQIDYKPGVANNLKNMGNICLYQGNRPKALDYARKALAMYEELGDQEGIGASLDNLGNLYYEQNNFEAALKYASRSLKIYQAFGDKNGIAGRLSNIGSIYWSQKNYSPALEYNQQALDLYQELGNKQGVALIMSNNGAIHLKLGNTEVAMDFAQEALKLNEELGKKEGVADNLINIGTIHKIKSHYTKALDYCKKGLKLAEEIGALEHEKNACKCLYDINKVLGKGTQALLYLERKQVIEDSLKASETAEELQQMEFKKIMFQDSIVKAEAAGLIEEAHQQEVSKKNKTRNILLGSSFFLLLLAVILYRRWRYVRKTKNIIEKEKHRSDNLLLNIFPADIAEELKENGKVAARDFEKVSILFTDFKGFTEQSAQVSPSELVAEINHCFEAFDALMEKYGIEKIKTIGDAYMAAGGFPVTTKSSVKNTVLAALEMQDFIQKRLADKKALGTSAFEMRVGIHTGPVVAGIVGVKKFQYDVWGDTVNTASRLESNGAVGKINISRVTYELLKNDESFSFENRGKIEVKGKGEIEMYFVKLKRK